jgi:site-specific DNA-methyltransferase (adenine-specific)
VFWRVDCADAVEWLNALEEGSVDLIVTSPPYECARLYLEDGEDLGIARAGEEWVAWMVQVCRAASRACKGLVAVVCDGQTNDFRYSPVPHMLAADLHRAGFNLRRTPIYRRSGQPGTGGPDWLRWDHEPVVCLTRPGRLPWSDPTACGHPPRYKPGGEVSHRTKDGSRVNAKCSTMPEPDGRRVKRQYKTPAKANPGTVIDCVVGGGRMGSKLAHEGEAPFPESLAEFFIRSFCPPGGLVADCFCGSGSAGAVAVRLGRRFLGCDLRPSQVELSRRRISEITEVKEA